MIKLAASKYIHRTEEGSHYNTYLLYTENEKIIRFCVVCGDVEDITK